MLTFAIAVITVLLFVFATDESTGLKGAAAGTKVLSVEPADWEGTWIGPDGVEVALEVIDPKEGVIAVSLSEGTDDEPTRIRSMGFSKHEWCSVSQCEHLNTCLPAEKGSSGVLAERAVRYSVADVQN